MKIIIQPVLCLAFLCTPVVGQDLASPWNSVQFSTSKEEVKASVELEAADEQLTKVSLTVDGQTFTVPEAELADCELPHLDTANLLFGADWYGPVKPDEEKTPHYIIELTFGEVNKYGTFTSLKFLFHDGKYQERIILEQSTPTLWQEYRKRPGESEKESGTVTRPAPLPGPPAEEATGESAE